MKKKTELQFRQQFDAVLDGLDDGEPVLIERSTKPVAVVVPYEMFQRNFVKLRSSAERRVILDEFIQAAKPTATPTIDLIKELRYGVSK